MRNEDEEIICLHIFNWFYNFQGITIPSQIRYIKYFEKWVHWIEINSSPIIKPFINCGESCAISIYKIVIYGIPTSYKHYTGN